MARDSTERCAAEWIGLWGELVSQREPARHYRRDIFMSPGGRDMLDFITGLSTLANRRGPGDPLVSPPSPPRPLWLNLLTAVAILDFLAFVLVSGYLGGSALNGYVQDGHYFLANHAHSQGVEVTRAVFMYNKWHAYSVIFSFGAVALISLLHARREKP
jgi:hypothetical protein